MRKKAIGLACLGLVLWFSACHKSSSSSASGSLAGALNDLALLALNGVQGNSFPTIGPGCSPLPTPTGNFVTGNPPPQSVCPSSSYTPTQTYTSSTISLNFQNCSYGGYFFSGKLAFAVGSPVLSECTLQANSADVYLTGSYTLTSSSFTISGNGLNASCNSNGGSEGPISLTASGVSYETVPSPSTLVGTLNGQGCQTKISNLKFFWQ